MLSSILIFGAFISSFFLVTGSATVSAGCSIIAKLDNGNWSFLNSIRPPINGSTYNLLSSCLNRFDYRDLIDAVGVDDQSKNRVSSVTKVIDGFSAYKIFIE